MPSAYLAPDLFFLLSGFVIAHAYELKLASGLSVPRFILLRAIRLYPLYIVSVIISIAALTASNTDLKNWPAALSLAAAAAFLPGSWPIAFSDKGFAFGLNPPAWSLLYELVVNAGYGLIFPFLSNQRLRLVCLVFCIALITVIGIRGTMAGGWNFGLGQVVVGFVRVGFSFSLGVLIYRYRKKMPTLQVPAVAFFLSTTIVFMVPAKIANVWTAFFEVFCILFVFPILLIVGHQLRVGKTFQSLLTTLGVSSYGIYVLHFPTLQLFLEMQWLSPNWGSEFVFLGELMVLVLLLHRFYDVPARNFLVRALRSPTTRASNQ